LGLEKKNPLELIPRNEVKKKSKWGLGLLVIAMWITKDMFPNDGD